MFLSAVLWLSELLLFLPVIVNADDCPKTFPIKFNGKCYALQTDGMKFQDAGDMCRRLGGKMTSIRNADLLEKIEDLIYNFITKNLENAKFWLGLLMADRNMRKPVKDRDWEWVISETKFVQKDYKLWDEEGGPSESALTCAAVDCANEFMVKPLDCGGSRLPVICMMREGKTCKHDIAPYLAYGEYCLAVLKYADAYGKVAPGCEPEAPTPYLEEMKPYVMMAAKNSFLGGGLLMFKRKMGDKFIDLETGEEPAADEWEEGEPRDQYDCVGLSLQSNNKLKLKTISCEFPAAYLCVHGQ